MNFGKWIVVAFVFFAVFIGTLVTICVRQDISLVSKEYYKDELAYQAQIVRANNTSSLLRKPTVDVRAGKVMIDFNGNVVDDGSLKLFCPSDSQSDRELTITEKEGGVQAIDASAMKPGMYKAKLHWRAAGKEYYLEQVIFI